MKGEFSSPTTKGLNPGMALFAEPPRPPGSTSNIKIGAEETLSANHEWLVKIVPPASHLMSEQANRRDQCGRASDTVAR